jgi:hypothetical protein
MRQFSRSNCTAVCFPNNQLSHLQWCHHIAAVNGVRLQGVGGRHGLSVLPEVIDFRGRVSIVCSRGCE